MLQKWKDKLKGPLTFQFQTKSQILIPMISLGLVLFYNFSFFENVTKVYPVSLKHLPFTLSLGLLLFSLHCLVMVFLDFKYLLKWIVIPTLLLSSLAAFGMDTFHYMIDYQIYQIILEFDLKETLEFITIYTFIYLLILGILPSLALYSVKIEHMGWKTKLKFLAVIFLLLGVNIGLQGKNYADFFRNHKPVRYYTNPITWIYSAVKYTKIQFKNRNIEFTQIGLDAKRVETDKKKLVILVVGETARSANFSLNGYTRKTNPLLEARTDIVSLKEAYSCGTETSRSLPCMFSKFSQNDYTNHRGKYFENFLDILKRVNVRLLWRDNDSGCKRLCDRIEYHDLNHADIKPFCHKKDCWDEVLLSGLEDYIDKEYRDTVIVLHKKGNHGPAYFKRYPPRFEIYKPTCLTERLQECETKTIVNAYDNIIRYTDFFLNTVIEKLKTYEDRYDTLMVYVSDHGESLGENGIYLHAMPYWIAPKFQIHIPFIFWGGEKFKPAVDALRKRENEKFNHDILFHTMLGVFDVETKEYLESLDVLKETNQ